MVNLKLLKKVHLLPKLSLATCLKEYYDWEEHMEDFFWGRGLKSALKMYYAEETMAKDILLWWDRWDKKNSLSDVERYESCALAPILFS
jgi:hypothetical protein